MKPYVCPMHPKIISDRPGKCPICGMDLVLKANLAKAEQNNYLPLAVIIGLILLVTFALSLKDFQGAEFLIPKTISYFMIGFFLVFSGFKLLDLKGFAEGYSTYDLLAQRVYSYGFVYPFIELFFGLAMIFTPQSKILLLLEIIVMLFSGIGVAIKIAKNEKFQCACLGTFLKVPLTKVTLVEDFGMAGLALMMIFLS